MERRIRDLEDQLAAVGRGNDRQEGDIAELKRKHEAELEKLKVMKQN